MIIQCTQVYLRALEEADAHNLYELSRSSDAHLSTTPFWRPWRINDFQMFVAESWPSASDRLRLAICSSIEGSERLIGVIELHKLNWIHGNSEVGIIIWPSESRRKGFGTLALRGMCNWAFSTLRLRRLYAKTFATNVAAQKCFEKVGFKHEGIWREHFFVDGQVQDAFLYGLLKDELLRP